MNDTLMIVLIAGVVVAILVLRRRPSIDPRPPVSHESNSPSPRPLPLSEDERLAQEAAEVRNRWDKERQAVERAHSDEMRPVMEKLDKARELVRTSGVGESACVILGVMWHWPSWSKRDNWKMPVPIEGLDGGPTPGQEGGSRGVWLGWIWGEERFRLDLTVSPNYTNDDSQIADLKLTLGEELVMHLDVSQRSSDEYYKWHVFGVSAFKAGPWMATLNDLAGRLRIVDRQWMRDHEKSFYSKKAEQIDLG